MSWQDYWEAGAAEERAAQDATPVGQLLEQVRQGYYDSYYGIWYAIAARATLEQAGWSLFEVLGREPDYLHRYHCAAALLKLLGNTELAAAQLSAEHPDRAAALVTLEQELRARLGVRSEE